MKYIQVTVTLEETMKGLVRVPNDYDEENPDHVAAIEARIQEACEERTIYQWAVEDDSWGTKLSEVIDFDIDDPDDYGIEEWTCLPADADMDLSKISLSPVRPNVIKETK